MDQDEEEDEIRKEAMRKLDYLPNLRIRRIEKRISFLIGKTDKAPTRISKLNMEKARAFIN